MSQHSSQGVNSWAKNTPFYLIAHGPHNGWMNGRKRLTLVADVDGTAEAGRCARHGGAGEGEGAGAEGAGGAAAAAAL